MRGKQFDGVLGSLGAGNIPAYAGKPSNTITRTRVPRNIPAYAGKTLWGCLWGWVTGEYPRVCGENKPTLPEELEKAGTSPRMRGKLSPRGGRT